MRLNKLSLRDREIFAKYLSLSEHELSVYAFQNIYIWRGLFDIYWRIIADSLCVFFKDKRGCFLYLEPLARKIKPEVIQEAFRIMDGFNQDKAISRIENVEAKEVSFYRNLGYLCQDKPADYLCRRTDLVRLKGNRFKSKRACLNYFGKHYKFVYLAFSLRHKNSCLRLYNRWMKERKAGNQDPVYQGMLGDSRVSLKILLDNYRDLDFIGRVVKINGKISAFTFGFKLNQETSCILYEITDLSIKGLSQFIFHEFCGELTEYKYINVMDDSGLENLKRVKLSYHPARLIPNYIITRKYG